MPLPLPSQIHELATTYEGMSYTRPTLLILRDHLRCRGVFLRRCLSTKSGEALRILFCGSDEFSIASLKALYAEHLQRPESIESIEVVCRPGKRVGRGLKKIREGNLCDIKSLVSHISKAKDFRLASPVPIKDAATKLGLRIHEIDTFTGWTV